MTRNDLVLKLLKKLDEGVIYDMSITKRSVIIYLVGDLGLCKTIKLNKNIQEQFDSIKFK